MSTPGEKTEARVSLAKSGTSPAFSVSGVWTLSTHGRFLGRLLVQSRDEEVAPWRNVRSIIGRGYLHSLGEMTADNVTYGSGSDSSTPGGYSFYRIVFRASRSTRAALVISGDTEPYALFKAEKLVIDP